MRKYGKTGLYHLSFVWECTTPEKLNFPASGPLAPSRRENWPLVKPPMTGETNRRNNLPYLATNGTQIGGGKAHVGTLGVDFDPMTGHPPN